MQDGVAHTNTVDSIDAMVFRVDPSCQFARDNDCVMASGRPNRLARMNPRSRDSVNMTAGAENSFACGDTLTYEEEGGITSQFW
jgi:hypothetical protein